MTDGLTLPPGFDCQAWVWRWEKMQQRYLMRRAERFVAIAGLLRATQPMSASIIDLGCGPGSLILHLLEALPQSRATGFDFDASMLCLARPRLSPFGNRARVSHADLRNPAWTRQVHAPVDAVVSATSLHWLKPADLEELYCRIAAVLRPGGIFLNADHVASDSPVVQTAWEESRARMCARETPPDSDDWEGFWRAFACALGIDVAKLHGAAITDWEGVEDGLPLAWHFDKLRAAGFTSVDCFWRLDCDAIYGAFAPSE